MLFFNDKNIIFIEIFINFKNQKLNEFVVPEHTNGDKIFIRTILCFKHA